MHWFYDCPARPERNNTPVSKKGKGRETEEPHSPRLLARGRALWWNKRRSPSAKGVPQYRRCSGGLSLVDTGRTHTLVSKELFIRLPHVTMLCVAPRVQSITGHRLAVCGTCIVKIGGLQTEVLISENLDGIDLLVGANLCASRCSLDFTTKTMTLGKKEYPMTLSPEMDSQAISAVSIVPPMDSPLVKKVLLQKRVIFSTKKMLVNIAPSLVPAGIDTGDHAPIRQNPYRKPLLKREKVEECVKEMLADRIFKPSSSPWASPITLAPKKDGGTRFCVDYRK